MTHSQQFLVRLDDLAVLRIHGADAVAFVQAQLSNDISTLTVTDARLAAYCNPKGRMLASLVIVHETPASTESLLAVVKADIVESLLKRLRMFVLRSKVTLDVAPYSVWGVARGGAANLPWHVQRHEGKILVAAPTPVDGPARHWVLCADDCNAADLSDHFEASMAERDAWYAQDIEAGLGWVEQGNLELFIPQSLNFDLNGGVSFTKGCYPGQEVVARAHFRGAVKRRGIPAHCVVPSDILLAAGQDIYDANNPRSPAGRIINAARTAVQADPAAPHVAWQVFVEVNLADLTDADLRVVSAEGPALRSMPLPYSLESSS